MAVIKLASNKTWDDREVQPPRFENLAKGENDPRTGQPCPVCENFPGGGMHWGSPMCRSYGLGAKGGKRAHCTCDACF